MATHHKVGRKSEAKTWEQVLRHTFRTSFAEDSDLHTLMFVAGDQLSLIIQVALKEFVIAHSIPTNDNDFQSKVFLQAAMQYAQNKSSPTAVEVLRSIDRLEVVDQLMQAVNQNPMVQSRNGAHSGQEHQPQFSEQSKVSPTLQPHSLPTPGVTPEPVATNPNTATKKKPPIAMDFGPPEVDELADSTSEPKPSLRDKWLQNHQYAQ